MFEQGTNATLTCNNQGGPNNTIIWEVDGGHLPIANSHQISVLVNVSSGGNYTCTVSNAAGSETDSTMLYVYPVITQNPDQFVDAINGSTIDFSCDAESFPEPMYQWVRPDGLVVRNEVIRTNVLGFDPVLFGDEGTYICRVFITINGTTFDVNSTTAVLTRKSVIIYNHNIQYLYIQNSLTQRNSNGQSRLL